MDPLGPRAVNPRNPDPFAQLLFQQNADLKERVEKLELALQGAYGFIMQTRHENTANHIEAMIALVGVSRGLSIEESDSVYEEAVAVFSICQFIGSIPGLEERVKATGSPYAWPDLVLKPRTE